MAYIKKTWKDYPDTSTPITAEALQNIEDGIEALDTDKANKTDIVDNLIIGQVAPTNVYVGDKRVYCKIISVGQLPATASEKFTAHGLSNITFIRVEGIAYNAAGTLYYPLPMASGATPMYMYINNQNVAVGTTSDRSALTNCYVYLYFTYN